MKRKIYEKILEWKSSQNKKPLMILGARQVGKTYIIEEFCKNEFKNHKTINLLYDKDIKELYDTNLNSEEKFLQLQLMLNVDLNNNETILFIDEIQESSQLLSGLKFFCEKHNNINIICAGSLLGLELKRSDYSFPVGKIMMLTMYPMDFEEFLTAQNEDGLIAEIKKCYQENKAMVEGLHNKALKYYRMYLITGGMPEVVASFIGNSNDIINFDTTILNNIKDSYFKDMKRYVKDEKETLKIVALYNSIPNQLANLTNKFQYNKIEHNGKKRDYELAIDWLLASNLVIINNAVTLPEVPLKGFINDKIFKLYLNDVGLLNHILEIQPADIYLDKLSLYKGIITENYVAQSLICNGNSLYYWQSEGKAEIDFLIYNNDGIIPVEVKSSLNNQSKSLKIYVQKYHPKYSIKISTKNFGLVNNIKSVPLYAVFCIKN